MMNKSRATVSLEKALAMAQRGYDKASGAYADIPLGHTRLDPRTEKKRAQEKQTPTGFDSNLTRILNEIRSSGGVQQVNG